MKIQRMGKRYGILSVVLLVACLCSLLPLLSLPLALSSKLRRYVGSG